MQPSRPQPRAPGSFSPLVPGFSGNTANSNTSTSINTNNDAGSSAAAAAPVAASARPIIRRLDTSATEDAISLPKTRTPQTPVNLMTPTFPTASPQNLSRHPRSVNDAPNSRNASPLTVPPARTGHVRKHSQTPGLFEPSMPSTSASNLLQIGMTQSPPALPASQIAAQAAMQHLQHSRHRSQTVPFPGNEAPDPSKSVGPRNTPLLSLTEASAPRDNAFASQVYHNGLLGSHTAAAATAANVVFPRSPSQTNSPVPPIQEPAMPIAIPEKPAKSEKSKVKLFSRPKKIDTKSESSKDKPAASPGKIGSALASLQRSNYSTTSLVESPSLYNLNNSSSATIRPIESPVEKEVKEKDKERKHHFLSRQKHKLTNKDDHHLPLSSAASNSRPVDPNAPSSLYNFNNPSSSPGPSSAFGKSVSGLDLRHGGRALRERRKEEKLSDIMRLENDSAFGIGSDWPGPSSLGSSVNGSYFHEAMDSSKYSLSNLSLDDAWPFLKARLLPIFEGDDLRLPVEDFNRVVSLHIQHCIQRRSAQAIIDDFRDLLTTGFASLEHALSMTPDDRVIPILVELWVITFTSILPYLQAVFLPLDLEFSGAGSHLAPEQAKDFWNGVVVAGITTSGAQGGGNSSNLLDVRRLVLMAYRDILILPRYEQLKPIFSRLSLDHLPYCIGSPALALQSVTSDNIAAALATSPSDGPGARPGTAMSLDPSVASFYSGAPTVFGNESNPSRSRAISNVSYASGTSDPASNSGGPLLRPFTPQIREGDRLREIMGSVRDQNIEDSKQVTEMVGRLLQCMSVLASVGSGMGDGPLAGVGGTDEPSKMVGELGRLLKVNWLGRGRTGRNRRGMIGARIKQPILKCNSLSSRELVPEGLSVNG